MSSANQYPKMGNFSIVPAADLTSLTAACNVKSPGRLGDGGFGKTAGMIVVRDAGSSDYRLVFAHGSAATDKWEVVDGSVEYTPS